MDTFLKELKTKFSTIQRIDLNGNAYKSILKLLDGCSEDQLVQLKKADIKFVSLLAENRLARRTFWN